MLNRLKDKVAPWISCRCAPCERMCFLISQSIDRKLSLRELSILKFHSRLCFFCCTNKEQLERMRRLLLIYGDNFEHDAHDPLVVLSLEARENIKMQLQKHIGMKE